MAKSSKKVSRAALFARINRRLAKDGEALRRCPKNRKDHHTLGDVYVVDLDRNAVVSKRVDLRRYAKTLGALKAGEVLADE